MEYFKCLLRTFWAQFWVLSVKNKDFRKIWQICQIHLEKAQLSRITAHCKIQHFNIFRTQKLLLKCADYLSVRQIF